MEALPKTDPNASMESEVIEFMKSHRHLTVRDSIALYTKQLKDQQWEEYEIISEQLRKETNQLVAQV
jgi:hypothetical protein